MLVLSRKENEKVLFPHLGIALQILRVNGGKVRLGLEAPSDVSIVRYEIASPEQIDEFSERLQQSASNLDHEARNRLQTTLLALCVIQKQLARNLTDDAEATLGELIAQMQGLEREVSSNGKGRRAADRPRRRALIVEDNSNEQRLLASYLALSGYDVDTVDDGMKALDWLASHDRPDAVVMDMQLPRLGGAAAVGVLRSDPRFRGLKVYAVSGMDRRDAHVPVGPEGVDHWFAKPLDPQLLVERMNAELALVGA
jgi:carbon storage regulator CsrA